MYGQGLVELGAGLILLIPIALFLFDMYVMSLTNQMVDKFAKDCARAAANQPDQAGATQAAQTALQSFYASPYCTQISLTKVDYVPNDTVSVTLDMDVHLPVPMPGISSTPHFHARSTEPIVTVSH